MQKTQLMNNQQCTTYFPCCFVLMPRCLTFLSSISLWFFPRFYCPNILSFQIILMSNNTVPPNSPVVLCWCHHMELFYLLYRYDFFQDFSSLTVSHFRFKLRINPVRPIPPFLKWKYREAPKGIRTDLDKKTNS